MKSRIKEFTPQSISCFKEGYTKEMLFADIFSGISVGVIALPLALAFAIASGVLPEQGLFTAIIAGFLISLLGGSHVQIGGPTGAFVVVVYAIIQRHGYEGLALATLIASVLMILMGLARFGVLLKFIPYPVTTGFTTGIAVVIVSSQIKDFFGLEAEKVPAEFIEKCKLFCQVAHTWNLSALFIAFFTTGMMFIMRRFIPKCPGAIMTIILTTLIVSLFDMPVETINSKFGEIPNTLPTPALPFFSWELFKTVFPDAVTIAMLGAIESLLSAVVADGMTGQKHRSNLELIAQGIANMGSIFFKGIPATGAIARTTANIKMGAKTPVSGIVHAVTLLLLMLFLAPLAGIIPLATLAGILIFVAWNMAELPHFFEIMRGQKADAAILLITFFLTVLIDLSVAVQVGVILAAAIFLKRMTDTTTVKICQTLIKENEDETPQSAQSEILLRKDIPDEVSVFEITGPFFYPVADLLDEALHQLNQTPKIFILRMHKSPLIDATGLKAIKNFAAKCKAKGILFLICEVNQKENSWFARAIEKDVEHQHQFTTLDNALAYINNADSKFVQ